MDASFIRGVIPALVTPMSDDEALDREGLVKLIDGTIDSGVHGVFTVGTAGEFWALSFEEKQRIYEWTVEAAGGRVPAYVGTSANSTEEAIALSRAGQAAGADCLSILTPSFTTPTQEELFNHYAEIATSVTLPILLYNLPARTGNALEVETVRRLVADYGNIVGIKDSSGDFSQALEYINGMPDGFRFVMGRDTLIASGFEQGAVAAIAATANVAPDVGAAIFDAHSEGDLPEARRHQIRLAPLRSLFTLGTHPAMLKTGADLVGFAGGPPRRPAKRLSQDQVEILRAVLVEMGKLS
ncbi:MAG: 4-hydroxy-tetrahydrodipicolinate synthase [Gemmatimonadetes bacterium]|nr:4-hydroxy-tetrahydrodipicolinate synthase [Gemmatimonadota bacterium]